MKLKNGKQKLDENQTQYIKQVNVNMIFNNMK